MFTLRNAAKVFAAGLLFVYVVLPAVEFWARVF